MSTPLPLASARLAVARIRLLRKDRARGEVGRVVITMAAGLGALLYVPLLIFLAAQRTEPGTERTLHFVLLLTLTAPLPLAYMAAYNVLMLPLQGARAAARLPARRVVADAERTLEERGFLDESWLGAGAQANERRAATASLQELDGELRWERGVFSVHGAAPMRCAGCGGAFEQVGPGLRRCAHCGRGRYDALPPPSPAWVENSTLVTGSVWHHVRTHKDPMTPSWRFLFVGWAVTTPFLLVGFAAVSLGYNAPWVLMLLGIGGISALFPLFAVFKVWRVVSFLMRHLPARRRARHTLRQEVLRLVGEHGAVGIDDLARHLAMEPRALEAEASALMAGGQLPVFHDRAARRLVHAACAGFDTRCPTCGGALAPSRRGLTCAGCGHVAIALRTA